MATQDLHPYSDQSYKIYADILIDMAREAWSKLDRIHREIVFGCFQTGPDAVPAYPCGIKSYINPEKNCVLSLPELIIEAYGMQVMEERLRACDGNSDIFRYDCAKEYFQHAAAEYKGNPHVVSIDTARALHPFYDVNQPHRLLLLNRCTRGIGNWVSTHTYQYLLENQRENPLNQVHLIFASQGSGKSSVTHQLNKEDKDQDKHAITLDGVYDDFKQMKKLIDAALERGLPVSITYVHTPAIEAASRALTRTLEDGRPIRLGQILKRNTQFRKQLLDLRDAYQGDNRVSFDLWLNGGSKPVRYSEARKRLGVHPLEKDKEFQEFVLATQLQEDKDKTRQEVAEIEAMLKKRAQLAKSLRRERGLPGIYLKRKDTTDFSQTYIPLSAIIEDQLRDPDPSWQRLQEEVEKRGDFFTLLENTKTPPALSMLHNPLGASHHPEEIKNHSR